MKALIILSFLLASKGLFANENDFYASEAGGKILEVYSEIYSRFSLESSFQSSQGELVSHRQLFKERDKMVDEVNELMVLALDNKVIGNTDMLVSKLSMANEAQKEKFLSLLEEYKSKQLNTENLETILNTAGAELVSGNYI